jgi:single-strand DNA-binding protein
MNFNKLIIGGNLVRDPELRFTQANKAVVHGTVAVNESWTQDGEKQEKRVFVDFTMWGKRAEAFEKYHNKGDSTFLEGKLQLDNWEDKETGKPRNKLFMYVTNWEFINSGPKADKPAPAGKPDMYADPDDIPF